MDKLKKRGFTHFLIAFLAFISVAILIIKQQHGEIKVAKKEMELPIVAVSTIIAEPKTVNRKMILSGLVVGREEIPVYSDLSQGRIIKVLVEEGQNIKLGQLLASVDTTALKIQKAQQEATQQHATEAITQQETLLDEAKSQYEQAKSEKLRADAIADSGLLSIEAIEQRATVAKVAESRVKTAQSNLAMAQADFSLTKGQTAETALRLNQASINAPASGKVISCRARTGLLLGQNTEPLFVILRNNLIEVELEVSASELEQLKTNTLASIQITGNATTYNGKVRHTASQIDSQSQSAKIRVSFNKPPNLTLGQVVHVTIMLEPQKAIYLPDTAIVIEGTSSYVLTIKDGKALRIPIKTGDRSNGLVEVIDGVSARMPIIDRFAAYLHDGEAIKVITSKSTKIEPTRE